MTADPGMPVRTSSGGVRVERVVTSGVFELDGGSWEVDNNVWLVGDDNEVLVVDAAHDAGAILAAERSETRRVHDDGLDFRRRRRGQFGHEAS